MCSSDLFPTLDIGHIIKDILKLNIQYMIHEEKRNTEFWTEPDRKSVVDGGVMKRLDLAINDHTGMLDIPELTEKCRKSS